MDRVKIGLLHPGAMGAGIGAALVAEGQQVVWVSRGRSDETRVRAEAAGLDDAGDLAQLVGDCRLLLSVCPPHAALEQAQAVAAAAPGGEWTYLDANAVSPATAARMASVVERAGGCFVDGGIIGLPPGEPGGTRLYLSGEGAVDVTVALASARFEVHVVSDRVGDASAVKLAYAAWTKGSTALLLTAREAARRAGVEDTLLQEWATSQPGLVERYDQAARSTASKGWRWAGEMDEIAAMLGDLNLPDGFHTAAAQVYRRPEPA